LQANISTSIFGAGIPKPGHRARVPHAATQWEPLGLIRKGWGASPNKWSSIMMHKIAIGLAAAAIATAGSTLRWDPRNPAGRTFAHINTR